MAFTSDLEIFNPAWADLFSSEEKLLRPLFGKQFEGIHHVGSTAIPGVIAKPEIDILVILKEDTDFSSFFSKIESVGYTFRGEEPGAPGHWYFSKNQNQRRTHKLHLCGPTHPCVADQILFRDFLKKNPDCAREYSELKRQLAQSNGVGMTEYLAKKAPLIQEIIRIAKSSSK
jgi:GrpB-like predicted nucleotidyltransferase (UPF0157 family)